MAASHEPSPDPNVGRIVAGLSDLAAGYDLILCDIWGVLHNGVACHASAADALMRFREKGGQVVLVTNAPRPNGPIREQLKTLRVPEAAYDDIVTSGDVTLASIVERGPAPVYTIGPERDLALFAEVERLGGHKPRLTGLAEADYAVVTGLFKETTDTPETYDPILEDMLARSMTMICANPDLVVHVGETLRYCAGAIAERYAARGGAVVYAGKPHPPIYEAALRLGSRARGAAVARARVLAIGDALRTDVAGAVMQGFDVLFITGGIHRDESHRTGDGQLDPDSYQRMIEAADHQPLAAMAALAW